MNSQLYPPVIRISDLASTYDKKGMLPVSPATIWRWVKEGKFPKPFKLASQTTVWDTSEIVKWLEDQKQTAGEINE
jgi:prophage regulatory protein